MNPYTELGVETDADPKTIRDAYRRRAMETHPDHGGDPEAFQRAKRASLVLLDPNKRARFDRDGVIEENAPDNAVNEVLVAVFQVLDAALLQCAQSGQDPTSGDMTSRMRALAQESMWNIAKQRGGIEQHLKLSEKLIGRFRPKVAGEPNRIAALLEQRISAQRQSIAKLSHDEGVLKRAMEMLDDYQFERDPAAPQAIRFPVSPNFGPRFGI